VESETYPIKAEGLRPDFARDDQVPFVDVVATFDPQGSQLALFLLNRDLQQERELVLDCRDFAPTRVLASETLTGADLKASNTFERTTLVAPHPLEVPKPAATMSFKLPARSYSVVHLATS
jgi:alpha-L-arabinofuranosidase